MAFLQCFLSSLRSTCQPHILFLTCCYCFSIYEISLEGSETAYNLNFYFWWLTVFKLPFLTISPFQLDLRSLLTNNCFTFYLYFWILKLVVISVSFLAQIILFLGIFPGSKSTLFLTSKYLTSERTLNWEF